MKIISLNGRPECGKTNTLKMVCERLSKEYMVVDKTECGPDIRITFRVNDIVVSVCTGGDSVEIIQENIAYFTEHECDLAISANRSKAGPKWELEGFAESCGFELREIMMPYAEFLGRTTGMIKVEELVADYIYKQIVKYVGKE